ncbi:cupin [Virgibacillus sp. 6R]|uniref:cupin n=1 Tax=Metabacillus sp. 22489 TaxID=3453928 RepID=UPI0011A89D1D
MDIQAFEYSAEGMNRVYENEKWLVGIKNWKPANDITSIDCLERHNETDELFVLIAGKCELVYANETSNELHFEVVKMEPFKVYNIPATLWHNTITEKDTKLVLIEDSSTSLKNTDFFKLSNQQIEQIRKCVNIEY